MIHMPESLKIILAIMLGVVLVCLLKLAVSDVKARPKIAIVAEEYYPPPLEGPGGYTLEWAKDGEMQIPAVFKTTEEREIFVKYLRMIGEVTR